MSLGQCITLRAADANRPTPPTESARVDLRPNFAKWNLAPKKQGHRNTCSVFTVTAALEYALARQRNAGTPLSEEYLNWACNQVIHNTSQDRGQFFTDLITGLERHGICATTDMPYARRFQPDYAPSPSAVTNAQKIKALGLQTHWIKRPDGKAGLTDDQFEGIKHTLRDGWPVCAGSFHSMLFVGYEDSADLPGGGQFLLRDSGGGNEQAMSYETARKRLCDVVWFEPKPDPSK